MVNLSSAVSLLAVLHNTSAVPHSKQHTSTACVSTSTVTIDFAALSSMVATETGKWSELAAAENTMVMNGFRSRRKGKNSLHPPIASPSATLLPDSFIVIPGTTEEEKHYSFRRNDSTMTLIARDDLTLLLVPLSKITNPISKTASPKTSWTSTSTSTPEDLTPLPMPLPEIVQPCNETASPTATSTSTSTPEDLTPLLMPLPDIIQPTDDAATPTASATQTSIPEDFSPLLMPPSNTVQPRSLIQRGKDKLGAAKVLRRGLIDWMANKLERLTGKNAEELASAIEAMHGVDVADR